MADGDGNCSNRSTDTGGSVTTRSTAGERRKLIQALDDPEALVSKRGRRGSSRGRSRGSSRGGSSGRGSSRGRGRGRGRSGGRTGRTVAEFSDSSSDSSTDSDLNIPLARTKKKPPSDTDTDTDVEKDEDPVQEGKNDASSSDTDNFEVIYYKDPGEESSADTKKKDPPSDIKTDVPAEEEDTDGKNKDDSAEKTDAKDDPAEETDAKDKDDPAEDTDAKDKDDPAEETDAKDKDDPADSTKRTIIIEHWPKAPVFRNRAKELQASIQQSHENINVLINPHKNPKKPSFVVRSQSGEELYLNLPKLKKPYKELTDFDLEDVVAKIVAK
ncbi:unnamed protein product [Amaranthus hypochondriacus]